MTWCPGQFFAISVSGPRPITATEDDSFCHALSSGFCASGARWPSTFVPAWAPATTSSVLRSATSSIPSLPTLRTAPTPLR